jgi:polyhydroxyalkanoate synthesis repressor PhaR
MRTEVRPDIGLACCDRKSRLAEGLQIRVRHRLHCTFRTANCCAKKIAQNRRIAQIVCIDGDFPLTLRDASRERGRNQLPTSHQNWAMAKNDGQTVIKKYANRRLYNTGTSTYVTLDDLAQMVKRGEDFTVQDAKSGDDITHSVLTQIIFEQESKNGNTLLPISFLRQLISYYGDQMQTFVPISNSRCMPSASSRTRFASIWPRRWATRRSPRTSRSRCS